MSQVNCTVYNMNEITDTPSTGTTTNGVPYVLRAPRGRNAQAPLVVGWHLLDPPRTEGAFAAALPLDGLDAWKLYLGLPMSGTRMPAGGPDALFGMLAEDAPGLVHGPIHAQAVAEAPATIAEVRDTAGIADGVAVGLMGGSMGGAIVAELLATRAITAQAAVLANPLLDLRTMIDAVSPAFGGYSWTARGAAAAARIDYVGRAREVAGAGAAIRVISGRADEPWFIASTDAFAAAAGADLQRVEGVGHALADEPGIAPAPQTDAARAYDALAVDWFARRLS